MPTFYFLIFQSQVVDRSDNSNTAIQVCKLVSTIPYYLGLLHPEPSHQPIIWILFFLTLFLFRKLPIKRLTIVITITNNMLIPIDDIMQSVVKLKIIQVPTSPTRMFRGLDWQCIDNATQQVMNVNY